MNSGRSKSTAGLRRLGNVYGASATLGAIADAVIARAQLSSAASERRAVMDLLAFIVEDTDTLIALEKGNTPSDDVLKRMAEMIAIDPPATVPEWEFLQTVVENVRVALGASAPGDPLNSGSGAGP